MNTKVREQLQQRKRKLLNRIIDTMVLLIERIVIWFAVLAVSWNIKPKYDPSGFYFVSWVGADRSSSRSATDLIIESYRPYSSPES